MTPLVQNFWTMLEMTGWWSIGFTLIGIIMLGATGFLTAGHVWFRHHWSLLVMPTVVFLVGAWIVVSQTVLTFTYGYELGKGVGEGSREALDCAGSQPGYVPYKKGLVLCPGQWTFPETTKYEL